MSDLDYAGAIVVLGTELVDEAPILDLRVRKAVRRREVPLIVATSRPSTLDPNADVILRYAPGAEEALVGALTRSLTGERDEPQQRSEGWDQVKFAEEPTKVDFAERAGASRDAIAEAAAKLRRNGPVVVLWGERLAHRRARAPGRAGAARAARARSTSAPTTAPA